MGAFECQGDAVVGPRWPAGAWPPPVRPSVLAAEQRQQGAARLVGDGQRLDPQLLLCLQGLQVRAFLGQVGIHQFCHIGSRAMMGGGSIVVQDVPPFTMVQGDRAAPVGINAIGLKRAGYTADAIKDVKNMYRLLYNEGLTVDDCIKRIETEVPDSDHRRQFVGFLRSSERGVCR